VKEVFIIDSISKAHQVLGLPKPLHPLVSVVRQKDIQLDQIQEGMKIRIDLFQIWQKEGMDCEMGYGRSSYDFREGTLAFIKAGQVLTAGNKEMNPSSEGWLLLFHPDLIRKSDLGENIHTYGFFDYETNEALHVSDGEKKSLSELIEKIELELKQPIDRHSQNLILTNIELLLGYCLRYYDRQFYSRTNLNQDLVSRFEKILREYFDSEMPGEKGLPTVKYLGEKMNMSSRYLSDLLRKESGRNAQEYIHHILIERAKNSLLGTKEAVSQIAYQLGFEYPQHFTKLFKSKTGMSPLEFRNLN
jgi:AraC family transcriptional regulator, transcriptional activator of pobA